jgi:hypothetical protein
MAVFCPVSARETELHIKLMRTRKAKSNLTMAASLNNKFIIYIGLDTGIDLKCGGNQQAP